MRATDLLGSSTPRLTSYGSQGLLLRHSGMALADCVCEHVLALGPLAKPRTSALVPQVLSVRVVVLGEYVELLECAQQRIQ
jgi:hypothetical protein